MTVEEDEEEGEQQQQQRTTTSTTTTTTTTLASTALESETTSLVEASTTTLASTASTASTTSALGTPTTPTRVSSVVINVIEAPLEEEDEEDEEDDEYDETASTSSTTTASDSPLTMGRKAAAAAVGESDSPTATTAIASTNANVTARRDTLQTRLETSGTLLTASQTLLLRSILRKSPSPTLASSAAAASGSSSPSSASTSPKKRPPPMLMGLAGFSSHPFSLTSTSLLNFIETKKSSASASTSKSSEGGSNNNNSCSCSNSDSTVVAGMDDDDDDDDEEEEGEEDATGGERKAGGSMFVKKRGSRRTRRKLRRTASEPFLHSWDYEPSTVVVASAATAVATQPQEETLRRQQQQQQQLQQQSVVVAGDKDKVPGLSRSSVSTELLTISQQIEELKEQFVTDSSKNLQKLVIQEEEQRYSGSQSPTRPRTFSTVDKLVTDEKGGVLGGTLSNLITQLANESNHDLEYVEDFLLTMHYVINLNNFVDLLIKRYDCRNVEKESWKEVIQQRVIMVFTALLQKHSYHFEGFETVLDRIYLFVEKEVTPNYFSGGLLLRALIEQYEKLKIKAATNHAVHSLHLWARKQHTHRVSENVLFEHLKSSLPHLTELQVKQLIFVLIDNGDLKMKMGDQITYKITERTSDIRRVISTISLRSTLSGISSSISSIDFLSVPVSDLAKQLTLFEHNIITELSPRDFRPKSSRVMRMESWSNQVSNFVASEILLTANIKKRTAYLARFISLAEECLKLNNFNSAGNIVFALSARYIERLHKTWRGLSRKSLKVYEQLKSMFSILNGFRALRNEMAAATPPYIPYFPLYQKDLTSIEEATLKELEPQVINFSRQRNIAGVFRSLRKVQAASYPFKFAPDVLNIMTEATTLSDDRLYELSQQLEPKHKELPI